MAKLTTAEYAALTGCAQERIVYFIKTGYLCGEETEDGWRVEPSPLRLGLARLRHYPYGPFLTQQREMLLRYRMASAMVATCLLVWALNPGEMAHYSKASTVVREAVAQENKAEKNSSNLGLLHLFREQLTDEIVMADFADNTSYHSYVFASTQTYKNQVISVGMLGYVHLLPQFNVENVRKLIQQGKNELKSLLQ